VRDAAHFHAPLHAAQNSSVPQWQRPAPRDVAARGDRRERIRAVVVPGEIPVDTSNRRAAPEHVERPAFGRPARPTFGGRIRSSSDQQPRASTRANAGSAPLTISGRAREQAHEVMELGLDRGEVREDVRMVELEVVQDRGAAG